MLTCVRGDGLGAQVHARASVDAFSSFIRIPYKESSFNSLTPKVSQAELSRLSLAFESTDIEITESENARKRVLRGPLQFWRELIQLRGTSTEVVINLLDAHAFSNSFPDLLGPYFRKFVPRLVAPLVRNSDTNERTGVLHLRRGLMSDSEFAMRAERPGVIQEAQRIFKLHKISSVTLCAYELHDFEFKNLPGDWTKKIGGSIYETILLGLTADCFIAAKSSLSYCIAGAREGLVYCEAFWHPKFRKWKLLPLRAAGPKRLARD